MSEGVPQLSYSLNLSFNENTANNIADSSLQYVKINSDNTIQTNSASPLTLINSTVPEAVQQVLTHYGVADKMFHKRDLSAFSFSSCKLQEEGSFAVNDMTFSNFRKIQNDSILNSTSYASQTKQKNNQAIKIDPNQKLKHPALNKLKKKKRHRRDLAGQAEFVEKNCGKFCKEIKIIENVVLKRAETDRKHDSSQKYNYSIESELEKPEDSCSESYSETRYSSNLFSNEKINDVKIMDDKNKLFDGNEHNDIIGSGELKEFELEKRRNQVSIDNSNENVQLSCQDKSCDLNQEKNTTSDALMYCGEHIKMGLKWKKGKDNNIGKRNDKNYMKDYIEDDSLAISNSEGNHSVLESCNEVRKILKASKVKSRSKSLASGNLNFEENVDDICKSSTYKDEREIKSTECLEISKDLVNSINKVKSIICEKLEGVEENYEKLKKTHEILIDIDKGLSFEEEKMISSFNYIYHGDQEEAINNDEKNSVRAKIENSSISNELCDTETETLQTRKHVEGKRSESLKNLEYSTVDEKIFYINPDETHADEKSNMKKDKGPNEKQKIPKNIVEGSNDSFSSNKGVQNDMQYKLKHVNGRKKKVNTESKKQIFRGTTNINEEIKSSKNMEKIPHEVDTKEELKLSKNEHSELGVIINCASANMKSKKSTKMKRIIIEEIADDETQNSKGFEEENPDMNEEMKSMEIIPQEVDTKELKDKKELIGETSIIEENGENSDETKNSKGTKEANADINQEMKFINSLGMIPLILDMKESKDKMGPNNSETSKNEDSELGQTINLASADLKSEKPTKVKQIIIEENAENSDDEKKKSKGTKEKTSVLNEDGKNINSIEIIQHEADTEELEDKKELKISETNNKNQYSKLGEIIGCASTNMKLKKSAKMKQITIEENGQNSVDEKKNSKGIKEKNPDISEKIKSSRSRKIFQHEVDTKELQGKIELKISETSKNEYSELEENINLVSANTETEKSTTMKQITIEEKGQNSDEEEEKRYGITNPKSKYEHKNIGKTKKKIKQNILKQIINTLNLSEDDLMRNVNVDTNEEVKPNRIEECVLPKINDNLNLNIPEQINEDQESTIEIKVFSKEITNDVEREELSRRKENLQHQKGFNGNIDHKNKIENGIMLTDLENSETEKEISRRKTDGKRSTKQNESCSVQNGQENGTSVVAEVKKESKKSKNKLIQAILKDKIGIIQSPEFENKNRKTETATSGSLFSDQENLAEDRMFSKKRKKHKKLFDVENYTSELLNDSAEIMTGLEDETSNISILKKTKLRKKERKKLGSLNETDKYSEIILPKHQNEQNNVLIYSNEVIRAENIEGERKQITQLNEKENSEDTLKSLIERKPSLIDEKREVMSDNTKTQKKNLCRHKEDHDYANAENFQEDGSQNQVEFEKKTKKKKMHDKVGKNINNKDSSENETKRPRKQKSMKPKILLNDHISNILSAKFKTFFEQLENCDVVDTNEKKENEAIFKSKEGENNELERPKISGHKKKSKKSESSSIHNISNNSYCSRGQDNRNIDEDMDLESSEEDPEKEYRKMQSYINNAHDRPSEDFVEQLIEKKNTSGELMISDEKPLLPSELIDELNKDIIDENMDIVSPGNLELECKQSNSPMWLHKKTTQSDSESAYLDNCEKLGKKYSNRNKESPLSTNEKSSADYEDGLSSIDGNKRKDLKHNDRGGQISTWTNNFLNSPQNLEKNLDKENKNSNKNENIRSDVTYLNDDMELEPNSSLELKDEECETSFSSPQKNNMHDTSRSMSFSSSIKNLSTCSKPNEEDSEILERNTSCKNDEIIEIETTSEIFIPNEIKSITEINITDSEHNIKEVDNELNMDKRKDTQSYINTFIRQSKLGIDIASEVETGGAISTISELQKVRKGYGDFSMGTVGKRKRKSDANDGTLNKNCVEHQRKKRKILGSKTGKSKKKGNISTNKRNTTESRSILEYFKKGNDQKDLSESESATNIDGSMSVINRDVNETLNYGVLKNSETNFEQTLNSNNDQRGDLYSFSDILSQSHKKRMNEEFDEICNESSRCGVYESESSEAFSNNSSYIDDPVDPPRRTKTNCTENFPNKDVFERGSRESSATKPRRSTTKYQSLTEKELLKEKERNKKIIKLIKESKSIWEIKRELNIPRNSVLKKEIKDLNIENPFPLSPIQEIAYFIITPPSDEQKEALHAEGIKLKLGLFTEEEDKKIIENWKKFCEHHDWDDTYYLPFVNRSDRAKHGVLPDKQLVLFVQFISHGFENRTMNSIFERFRRIISNEVQNCGRFTAEEDEIIMEYLKTNNCNKHFTDIAALLNRPRDAVARRYSLLNMNEKLKLTKIHWTKTMAEKFLVILIEETCVISLSELKNRKISSQEWARVGKRMKLPADRIKRSWYLNFYPRFFAPDYFENIGHTRKKLIDIVSARYSRWRGIDWGAVAKEMGDGFPRNKCNRLLRDLVGSRVPLQFRNDLNDALIFLKGKDLSSKNDQFSFLKEIMEETKNGAVLPKLNSEKNEETCENL